MGGSSPDGRRNARWRVRAAGRRRNRGAAGRGDPTRRTRRLGGRPHRLGAASSTRDLVWSGRYGRPMSDPVLAPDLPICDAHHHLWLTRDTTAPYTLDDLRADT